MQRSVSWRIYLAVESLQTPLCSVIRRQGVISITGLDATNVSSDTLTMRSVMVADPSFKTDGSPSVSVRPTLLARQELALGFYHSIHLMGFPYGHIFVSGRSTEVC